MLNPWWQWSKIKKKILIEICWKWQRGQSCSRSGSRPTLHQWRFTTPDSGRHTQLPRSRQQGCQPADPDTAGEPQTEQGRQPEVSCCTASWMQRPPHSDLDSVRDSQVNCAACPLSSIHWSVLACSTLCQSRSRIFFFLVSHNFSLLRACSTLFLQSIWTAWWGFLFLFQAEHSVNELPPFHLQTTHKNSFLTVLLYPLISGSFHTHNKTLTTRWWWWLVKLTKSFYSCPGLGPFFVKLNTHTSNLQHKGSLLKVENQTHLSSDLQRSAEVRSHD